MIDQATLQKLIEMRLPHMAESYREQMKNPQFNELMFEERFGILVDIEWSRRKSHRLSKLIKNARFQQPHAVIENIEYLPDRNLDRSQLLRFSTCKYIEEKHNLILLGATGAGKSYLSCALGVSACRNFYKVSYIRLPDLLNELAVARGEGVFSKVIATYKNVPLLILDEWLLVKLSHVEARDLLELIEARHQSGSTIFCSQFSPAGWAAKIGEDTLAEAILDRIVHNAYTVVIDGKESMRKRNAIE